MSKGLIDDSILVYNKRIETKPDGDPDKYSAGQIARELIKCSESLLYFINNYIYILDRRVGKFVLFRPYPAQSNIIEALTQQNEIIALKARQIGLTTIVGVAYFLWITLFEEDSLCLILSKSEREAKSLLVDRVRKSFQRLPSWMKPRDILSDSTTELALGNGSVIRSLPTSGGDSYTCRAVLVDEAALVHRSKTALSQVMLNVRPTVDAGGQLILVSKADKSRPESTFNNLFNGAVEGENDMFPIFASWRAVPWRDDAWYAREKAYSMTVDGTLDYLYESYPETIEQALMQKQLDKRFPYEHVDQCYDPVEPIREHDGPELPGLQIYKMPEVGKTYIVCVDSAEGNPGSDDSCADVFDWDTGEQVANMAGTFEPRVFGLRCAELAAYYNNCLIWAERNNHGHTLIAAVQDVEGARLALGPDSPRMGNKKYGYFTTARAKAIGYDELAAKFRNKEVTIRKRTSHSQLQSLDGNTLSAPAGLHDDHAITFMLFAAAKKYISLSFLIDFV